MPTYEYMCHVCQKEFEVVQSIKSEPVAACTICNVSTYTRLISKGSTFQLKGDGWAADNYSSKKS